MDDKNPKHEPIMLIDELTRHETPLSDASQALLAKTLADGNNAGKKN